MVSVVVPVFNRRRYLRSAILSLLNDLVTPEIWVVDDASSDEGLQTIEDLPIHVLRNNRRLGIAASRNRGLAHCSRSTVTFLDSDDEMLSFGLSWRVNFLEGHPTDRAVMGSIERVIGSSGESISDPYGIVKRSRLSVMQVSHETLKSGHFSPTCVLATTLFRREALEKVGAFDESLDLCSDWEFLHRFLTRYSIAYRDKPVLNYRLHEANASVDHDTGNSMPRRVKALTYLIDREYGANRWLHSNRID